MAAVLDNYLFLNPWERINENYVSSNYYDDKEQLFNDILLPVIDPIDDIFSVPKEAKECLTPPSVLMRVSTSGIVEHISGDCQEVYDSDNSELINFSFTKNIHPEDQQYVLQTLGKILWEQNSNVKLVYRRFSSTSEFLIEADVSIMKDILENGEEVVEILVLEECSQKQKLKEEELMNQFEEYRSFVNSQEDAFGKIDCFGKFLFISPSYESSWGFSPGEILNEHIWFQLCDDDAKLFQNKFSSSITEPLALPPNLCVKRKLKDKDEFVQEDISFFPVYGQGSLLYFNFIIRKIFSPSECIPKSEETQLPQPYFSFSNPKTNNETLHSSSSSMSSSSSSSSSSSTIPSSTTSSFFDTWAYPIIETTTDQPLQEILNSNLFPQQTSSDHSFHELISKKTKRHKHSKKGILINSPLSPPRSPPICSTDTSQIQPLLTQTHFLSPPPSPPFNTSAQTQTQTTQTDPSLSFTLTPITTNHFYFNQLQHDLIEKNLCHKNFIQPLSQFSYGEPFPFSNNIAFESHQDDINPTKFYGPKRPKKKRKISVNEPCSYCGTTDTSGWVKGLHGPTSLCSSCELKYVNSKRFEIGTDRA